MTGDVHAPGRRLVKHPILAIASWTFNSLAVGCVAGFAVILGLPTRHWILLPITILLLPAALILGLLACLTYPFAAGFSEALWRKTGIYATGDDHGIRLTSASMLEARIIPWSAIAEVCCISEPPVYTYRVRTITGEIEHIDFDDDETLLLHAKSHSVPVRGFEERLRADAREKTPEY